MKKIFLLVSVSVSVLLFNGHTQICKGRLESYKFVYDSLPKPTITSGAGCETTPSAIRPNGKSGNEGSSPRRILPEQAGRGLNYNCISRRITIANGAKLIVMVDVGGRIYSQKVSVNSNNGNLSISTNFLPKGIYIIQWADTKKQVHCSKIPIF